MVMIHKITNASVGIREDDVFVITIDRTCDEKMIDRVKETQSLRQ